METITAVPTMATKFVKPVDRFIIGLDIGKSVDATAIAVLHHKIIGLERYTNFLKKGFSKQHHAESYHVVALEKIPLGTPYPAQVHHVKQLLSRPPLTERTPLIMDDTGCGRPIGDMFVDGGLRPKRVTITSGLEVTQHNGDTWHVPKSVLISTMESRIHSKELKVAKALLEAGPMHEELCDFERHVSDSGRTTWGARVGTHDDIVLACSLAVWWAVRTALPQVTCGPIPFLDPAGWVGDQYVGGP
jgi:hypothetical protein